MGRTVLAAAVEIELHVTQHPEAEGLLSSGIVSAGEEGGIGRRFPGGDLFYEGDQARFQLSEKPLDLCRCQVRLVKVQQGVITVARAPQEVCHVPADSDKLGQDRRERREARFLAGPDPDRVCLRRGAGEPCHQLFRQLFFLVIGPSRGPDQARLDRKII